MPGTNCNQCGQPTCFTFVLEPAAAQVRLEEDCPPLFELRCAEQRAKLAELLAVDLPAIGSRS